jgi:hypothetical protein
MKLVGNSVASWRIDLTWTVGLAIFSLFLRIFPFFTYEVYQKVQAVSEKWKCKYKDRNNNRERSNITLEWEDVALRTKVLQRKYQWIDDPEHLIGFSS